MQNNETKWEEELENLKCINGAMYFGAVEEPCSGRETGECCHNEQTYEEAITELKSFISQEIEKSYQKGKKDKQFLYTAKEGSIVLIDKEMQEYTKDTRLQTLEEVEKVIKEKASIKTEDKVVDIAILLFSEDILQQLNKMKEHERHN